MSGAAPFDVGPTGSGWGDWKTLAASVAIHLLLVVLLITLMHRGIDQTPDPEAHRQQIALQPPIEFQQEQPRVRTPPPPPPERPIPLGPDSDKPDAPVAHEATPDATPTHDPALVPPEGGPPATTEQAPTEQPAREPNRIPTPATLPNHSVIAPPTSPFGRSSASKVTLPPARTVASAGGMGRTGFGAQDTRSFRESFPDAAGRCVELPDPGVNPDGSPVLFSVVGVVKDQQGNPLADAHLQMLGQIYGTFTNGEGEYRLEFNPKLIDGCRVQVIRVSAPGYHGADLQLSIGRRVRSDDVILKRR